MRAILAAALITLSLASSAILAECRAPDSPHFTFLPQTLYTLIGHKFGEEGEYADGIRILAKGPIWNKGKDVALECFSSTYPQNLERKLSSPSDTIELSFDCTVFKGDQQISVHVNDINVICEKTDLLSMQKFDLHSSKGWRMARELYLSLQDNY